jgi:hypothetical protein
LAAVDARNAEFAWCLNPQGRIRCVGYTAVVQSVTPNESGWEAILEMYPRIMSNVAGVVTTRDKCIETWQISKDGSVQYVKLEVPKTNARERSVMGD